MGRTRSSQSLELGNEAENKTFFLIFFLQPPLGPKGQNSSTALAPGIPCPRNVLLPQNHTGSPWRGLSHPPGGGCTKPSCSEAQPHEHVALTAPSAASCHPCLLQRSQKWGVGISGFAAPGYSRLPWFLGFFPPPFATLWSRRGWQDAGGIYLQNRAHGKGRNAAVVSSTEPGPAPALCSQGRCKSGLGKHQGSARARWPCSSSEGICGTLLEDFLLMK